jgi:hypothetical protein
MDDEFPLAPMSERVTRFLRDARVPCLRCAAPAEDGLDCAGPSSLVSLEEPTRLHCWSCGAQYTLEDLGLEELASETRQAVGVFAERHREMTAVFRLTIAGLVEIGRALGDGSDARACEALAGALRRKLQAGSLPVRQTSLSVAESAVLTPVLHGRVRGRG